MTRYDALFMRKISPLLVIGLCCLAFYPRPAEALIMSAPKPKFAYKDASGKKQSVEIVTNISRRKLCARLPKSILRLTRNCVALRPLPRNARARTRFPCAGVLSKKRLLLPA